MTREDAVNELTYVEARASELRRQIRRIDRRAALRTGATTTARVLQVLEAQAGVPMHMTSVLAAVDPKLNYYSAVACALANLVKYGLARRVRHGVYKACGV